MKKRAQENLLRPPLDYLELLNLQKFGFVKDDDCEAVRYGQHQQPAYQQKSIHRHSPFN
jgi:hypothetical protein